jgi:hypothetical protein
VHFVRPPGPMASRVDWRMRTRHLPTAPLLLLLALPLGCGRGQLELLDARVRSDAGDGGTSSQDVPDIRDDDGGFMMGDCCVKDDRGVPEPQCTFAGDCDRDLGAAPECRPGVPGAWSCEQGQCSLICDPQPLPCRSDCDCPFFLSCGFGECVPTGSPNLCCSNPDCQPGSECVLGDGQTSTCPSGGGEDGGVTSDGGSPMGPTAGAACMDSTMCAPGQSCFDEASGFPGGYCSEQCNPRRFNCGPGATCLDNGDEDSLCAALCVDNGDCRAGYLCVRLGAAGERVCWPRLPGGSTNPNGAAIGAACGDSQDCATDLLCIQEDNGWPNGYCTQALCDEVTNPCPTGTSCFTFPGSPSVCLQDCPQVGQRSTCRRGYTCSGPAGGAGICVPR